MNEYRKSIFDLERRIDLAAEYYSILENADETLKTVMKSIRTWPHRQAALSVRSYADGHRFSFDKPRSEEEILYSIELLINLLHWAPEYENKTKWLPDLTIDGGESFDDKCDQYIENIEYILEKSNMHVREIDADTFPQYVIGKRDVDVDTVLEAVPELSEALLSYLDIRNQKDEAAKKEILKRIADYLEPLRNSKKYKGTSYSQLCDDLFTIFNKCKIRHNDKRQWALKKPERMKLYDQTFKAAIHLLQSDEASQFKDTVAELKQRFENDSGE